LYKLVVIDLDNTLLDEEHKISCKNIDMLEKIRAQGIEVIIATGRMYSSAQPYLEELSLKNRVIVYNGAMVKDILSGQILYHKPIDEEVARKLIKDLKSEGLHINLYQDDKLYVDQDNKYKRRYERITKIKAVHVDNLIDFDFVNPTKLLIIEDDPAQHQYYIEYLKKNYSDIIDVTESKNYFIEIGAKGVNKGNTLNHLMNKRGLKREEVIAIGDGLNDIEMISLAGTGIAMDNAHWLVKQAADVVAPSHQEDGVAVILEKLIMS